jgi:multiple sugar transport system ATP-binding protein
MASVTYRNVRKSFGNTLVVRDVNIKVEDGEFLVFVGPSGSGKSTMLRMLAGLDRISDGEILIGDRVVNDVKPRDRDVAMVFQSYALYPHMSVFDNIAFGLQQRNVAKETIKERVEDTAQSLGIHEFLDRRPRQLSGGQRQRVALGRAIVREPKAFLLDEPLSNLDAKLRVEARAFLSRLHERLGATFIYVTHDQVEAMTMGNRIAVIANHYLQQVATPDDLYNYPDNLFVAGFIGSPAMNFFEGRVTRSDDQLVLVTDDFTIPAPEDRLHLLEDYVDKSIVLGVRPKDFHHPDYQAANIKPVEIEAYVEMLEMLGDEKDVFFRFSEKDSDTVHRFVARLDPRVELARGEKSKIIVDLTSIHIFDAETELAIRDNPVPAEHARQVARAGANIRKEERD